LNTDEEKKFTEKNIRKTSYQWFLGGIAVGLWIANMMMKILPIIFDIILK